MKTWRLMLARAQWLLLLAVLVAPGIYGITAIARADAAGSWANPSAITVKRVNPVGQSQNEPSYFQNLDCTLITYRVVSSTTMQSGCFTPTAFGMFDVANAMTIFNGTDEGIPLQPYGTGNTLISWPNAGQLIELSNLSTGGAHISLHRHPTAKLTDQRDHLGRLQSKKINALAEVPITDSTGQRIIINPGSLAFSDGGSWLVAETLTGYVIRLNLAMLDVMRFAPSIGIAGNPALLKSNIALADHGRTVAINNEAADSFKVYDLTNCNGQPVCASSDYRPYLRSQIAGLQFVRHVRFINQSLLSFEAVTSNPATSGIYLLSPSATIDSLTDYIGLGDSYTSGEGAFNYRDGTDTTDNRCHSSVHAYPMLLTRDFFSATGGHSVACSGARIPDIADMSGSYRGQTRTGKSLDELMRTDFSLFESIKANFIPGHIAQQHFVKHYQPRVVTVSIGGNDIGFGDMLRQCAMPRISRHLSDSICFNTYEDRQEILQLIDRNVPKWQAAFRQLKGSTPAAKIYVIGYPQIAVDDGDCAQNVPFSKLELEFSIEIVKHLNAAIARAAETADVAYVDIDQSLAGHRLCEADSHAVAVNGLTAGTDHRMIGSESFHPTAFGHQLIAQFILSRTNNLSSGGDSASEPGTGKLLTAPKSGRQTYTRVPISDLTDEVISPGDTLTIELEGARYGLKPNSTYQVRTGGPKGTVIGSVITDTSTTFKISLVIPSTQTSGATTLDITGPGQAGNQLHITQPVYASASSTSSFQLTGRLITLPIR